MDKFYKNTTADRTIHYGLFTDFTIRIDETEDDYTSKVTTESESDIIGSGAKEIDSWCYYKYLVRVGSHPAMPPH